MVDREILTGSAERIKDRSKPLWIAYDVVGDSELISEPTDLVDQLLDRATQDEWRLRDHVWRKFELHCELVDRDRVLPYRYMLHQRGPLYVALAISCRSREPCSSFHQVRQRKSATGWDSTLTVGQPCELKDVGVLRRERHNPPSMPSDQKWNGLLERRQPDVVEDDGFELSPVFDGAVIEQRPKNRQRLAEPSHARTWRANRRTDRFVLGLGVPGAHAQHQTPACQTVDRRRGSGKKGWVVELVVHHERAYTERRCRSSGDQQWRKWIHHVEPTAPTPAERCPDVVGSEQLAVAKLFDPAGMLTESRWVIEWTTLDCKPIGPILCGCHGMRLTRPAQFTNSGCALYIVPLACRERDKALRAGNGDDPQGVEGARRLPPCGSCNSNEHGGDESTMAAKLTAVLGNCKRTGRWKIRPNTKALVVFGNCKIDYRDAYADEDLEEIKLDVLCVFGRAVFLLPPGASVQPSAVSMFSSSSFEVEVTGLSSDLPNIKLESTTVFGMCRVQTVHVENDATLPVLVAEDEQISHDLSAPPAVESMLPPLLPPPIPPSALVDLPIKTTLQAPDKEPSFINQ